MNLHKFVTLAAALLFAGAAQAQSPKAHDETAGAGKWPIERKKSNSKPDAQQPKAEEKKKPYSEEKPFNDLVKDMEVIKGVFTFYRKPEENKIYLEILPNQFEQTFLFSGSIEQSVGERGLWSAQMGGHFPIHFRMIGKSVQCVILNSRFTAAKNSPSERATQRSFPNSILGSARILSQPHPERKSFLINLSDLLLSDIPGLAPALKEVYKPTDYRFDRANSSITAVRAFPENALLDVLLHYTTDNPRVQSISIPDERSIPVLVKYDFSALRKTDFRPRYADDRVGHFLTSQQDFTSDKPSSPYVRRIHRWNLQKADPSAPISEPKQPIVFWIENTVPLEYREWMKEGALLWNKAFERIGFTNAIVVKQQPDDADWHAADTRYNTIRWFAGVDATFAIGPSRANPYTGEIYDADIGFSEGIIRSIRRQGEEFIGPVVPVSLEAPERPHLAWDAHDGHFCDYSDGLAQQAAFGAMVLEARGALDPEMEERLMREFIIEVTAHEVGHTLGLRHNFRASTLLKPEQLMDESITSTLSQSASVMDYNPIVIAPKGQKQGHFVPIHLGPYDYWAIEYAYKPFLSREDVELAKVAGRGADPQLGYSTDEDARGTFSPAAVDPLVNQFDQSSDPLAYFQGRVEIINELWDNMDTRLVREGEGYQVLRRALLRSLGEYNRAMLISSKFVGGLYHYRDHAGDPNGRNPFSPVPAERQREALDFMKRYAFSEAAFKLRPELYNKLASERLPGLTGIGGLYNTPRIDHSWHESVLNIQKAVLQRLHAPVLLARLLDNELRFAPGEERFTMSDMFRGLADAIWSELDSDDAEISSLRRNLQREHLKTLTRLTLRNPASIPEDATSLARYTLLQLREKVSAKLASGRVIDPTTAAHLEETRARISAALEAQMAKALE